MMAKIPKSTTPVTRSSKEMPKTMTRTGISASIGIE